jgi:peptide/nickel transport system permease protein
MTLLGLTRKPWIGVGLRRLALALLTLAVIAYLTLFGIILAQRGQQGLPADLGGAAVGALHTGVDLLIHHPALLVWHNQAYPTGQLVRMLFLRSAGLLGLGLLLGALIGVPLGALGAIHRHRRRSSLVIVVSTLGISAPSFMLGMLLWMADIWVHRTFGIDVLPTSGFGWDLHLILPAVVLAARPLAQVMQVTYVSLSDALQQDFVRTARSKGLIGWVVLTRHALTNAAVPILTTLGTSLRFSLASLPVVEFFFVWPGLGLSLLDAIRTGDSALVVDLIVALGALFLVVNGVLELLFPILDPRLGGAGSENDRINARAAGRVRWREWIACVRRRLAAWRRPDDGLDRGQKSLRHLPPSDDRVDSVAEMPGRGGTWTNLLHALRTPSLVVGTLLLAGLLVGVFVGPDFSSQSPFKTHGVMMFEGTISAPPFPPSLTFPWGTDILGRDIQALVLAGARQTVVLALLATLARITLGTLLGAMGGWWRGGIYDRIVSTAIGVWASFPSTLFAMILILALGIKQGVGVFVLALSVVGWGEVAQFVRGKVVAIKGQPYVEGARVIGARDTGILIRHVLPNLVPSLLVLAVLEMGGVLLLLAELGFLNIFLGGGFTVELLGTQSLAGVPYHYSDVPEWGALLANVRDWWRAYPWLGWYPGVAFFVAILTFNLLGEGLRRFIDRSRINLSRWVNRYAVAVGIMVALGGVWLIRSSAPLTRYQAQAERFDSQRAMTTIDSLCSPKLEGRESGTPGALATANLLADQMRSIGLFPGGDDDTYLQTLVQAGIHLSGMPQLAFVDPAAGPGFAYRRDFAEHVGGRGEDESVEGDLIGLALGPSSQNGGPDPYGLEQRNLAGAVVLVHRQDLVPPLGRLAAGVLVIADSPAELQLKYLYKIGRGTFDSPGFRIPMMIVSRQAADRLLRGAGSSLDAFEAERAELGSGEAFATDPGSSLRMTIPLTVADVRGEPVINVIGYIPGTGAAVRTAGGASLDSQVIIVSAYYDGLGVGPDGRFYPGANDNASGVAAMLEMARILVDTPYPPKKTIVFVAWSGGERGAGFSVTNTMNAKIGFNQLTVEAVLELSGMAQGSGDGLALGRGTSFRLTRLFQQAGGRLGVSVTTRGRGPHFGLSVVPGFGDRTALSAYPSWNGSDIGVHTSSDAPEALDINKLERSGRTTLLVLSVLSREETY